MAAHCLEQESLADGLLFHVAVEQSKMLACYFITFHPKIQPTETKETFKSCWLPPGPSLAAPGVAEGGRLRAGVTASQEGVLCPFLPVFNGEANGFPVLTWLVAVTFEGSICTALNYLK